MKPKPNAIEDALVEVRSAYRLIHDHQRAALDAVRYVGNRLGFSYFDGCPNFSDPTPRGSASDLLERWSWDWLNLYFYYFSFERKEARKTYRLSIWLVSDTGYFAGGIHTEECDVATFASVRDSGTKVFVFFFRDWPDELDAFRKDRQALCEFANSGHVLPPVFSKHGAVGRSYDFSRLSDEASAEVVLSELVDLGRSIGFPVELIEKKT